VQIIVVDPGDRAIRLAALRRLHCLEHLQPRRAARQPGSVHSCTHTAVPVLPLVRILNLVHILNLLVS
jgi:hypothetical protein